LLQVEAAGEAERPERPGFVASFLAGQEVVWLSEALRILREEAPDIELTLSSQSSPELADALMQGKLDVALLRRETQTTGLAFKRTETTTRSMWQRFSMTTEIKPIRTKRDYEAALKEIKRLWGAKAAVRRATG
jgi:LysR substrate binding domain